MKNQQKNILKILISFTIVLSVCFVLSSCGGGGSDISAIESIDEIFSFEKEGSSLVDATYDKLPAWRGFNLTNMADIENMTDFKEEDFAIIKDLGFNYARLPIDYRCFVKNGDVYSIDTEILAKIDKAIEYGMKNDVHVTLSLKTFPIVNLADGSEPNFWDDKDSQEVFAAYWGLFANRYKNIGNKFLSFGLLDNIPNDVKDETYAVVMRMAIVKIQQISVDRLIFADGLKNGDTPSEVLKYDLIAQSNKANQPLNITQYKAPWIKNSDKHQPPVWPSASMDKMMYGTYHSDYQQPFVFHVDFREDYDMIMHVMNVSSTIKISVRLDGKEKWNKVFQTGVTTEKTEWISDEHNAEWNNYNCLYDKDYTVKIPAGTKEVRIVPVEGDWMTYSSIKFVPSDPASTKKSINCEPTVDGWGTIVLTDIIVSQDGTSNIGVGTATDKEWYKTTYSDKWIELKSANVGVIVAEFGVYNTVKHDIALRFMNDTLSIWTEAGMPWALRELSGPFGILDSERTDVTYVDYKGHKLDQAMLDLLNSYK